MLNKQYRFHSRGGVRYVFQKGKIIRSPKLSLVFAHNPKGFTRFAVVVSKKVLKSAVGRNFIRRRIYEAIRLNFSSFPKQRDYIIIVFSKDIANLPFKELEKALKSLVADSKVCYN